MAGNSVLIESSLMLRDMMGTAVKTLYSIVVLWPLYSITVVWFKNRGGGGVAFVSLT